MQQAARVKAIKQDFYVGETDWVWRYKKDIPQSTKEQTQNYITLDVSDKFLYLLRTIKLTIYQIITKQNMKHTETELLQIKQHFWDVDSRLVATA